MVFTSRLLPLSLLHAASVPHRATLTSTSTPNVTARPSTAAGLEGTLNSPRKKTGHSKTPTKAGVSQVRPSPARPLVGSPHTAAKPRVPDSGLQRKSVEKSTKKKQVSKQGEGKPPATPTRQCSVLLPQGGWSRVLINHTSTLVSTLSPFTSYIPSPLSTCHFPLLFTFPSPLPFLSLYVIFFYLLPFIYSLPLRSPFPLPSVFSFSLLLFLLLSFHIYLSFTVALSPSSSERTVDEFFGETAAFTIEANTSDDEDDDMSHEPSAQGGQCKKGGVGSPLDGVDDEVISAYMRCRQLK